jgi:hypothetical protein
MLIPRLIRAASVTTKTATAIAKQMLEMIFMVSPDEKKYPWQSYQGLDQ